MVSFFIFIVATRVLMVPVFRNEQDCAVSCGCSVVKRARKCRIREKSTV